MEEVKSALRKYLVQNYGELVNVAEPQYDPDRHLWTAKLFSNYPRILRDDKEPDKPSIRFLHFYDIGRITLRDDLSLIEATPREDVVANIDGRNSIYMERAERILVKVSAERLSELSEAMHVLNPVKTVVDALVKPLDKPIITNDDVESDDKPDRIRQYLGLMAELNLVRKIPGGYTYGPQLTALQELAKNDLAKVRQAVIAYLIKERYSILREAFDIRQFERYVHLGNCYYWPSLEAEKLLHTTKRNIYERYIEYYGKLSPVSFPSLLADLVQVGAIEVREDKYCYGNEELFDKMLQEMRSSRDANPPSA
jgi:hypothetical protein